jgi:hypothetical protein
MLNLAPPERDFRNDRDFHTTETPSGYLNQADRITTFGFKLAVDLGSYGGFVRDGL